MQKKMETGKTCGCQCHPAGHWVLGLSLLALGAVGLWWNDYFQTLLYSLLLLNGLLCLGNRLCKCC